MLYICLFIYNSVQKTISEEETVLVVYVAFFLLIIVTVFVLFFLTFQKRKNQLLIKNIDQQKKFDEELIKTQQEIQEETLNHIGRELHDNVGQLLVMSMMQMQTVTNAVDQSVKPKVENAYKALSASLAEVRAISKSLNSDVIFNLGFIATVKNEIDRINKIGVIVANAEISGDIVNFENKKDEIILFRILQEFFSNTLKYAEAETLQVAIVYKKDRLEINVKDDGSGFDNSNVEMGSGLINMKKRAELLNANFQLNSAPEGGTTLKLVYPFKPN